MIYARFKFGRRKEKKKRGWFSGLGSNWPNSAARGETGRGLLARRPRTAWMLRGWRYWASALAGLGPAARERGAGARPVAVHRGAGGPWPGCWWTRATSPFPSLRFIVHRAHPGVSLFFPPLFSP